MLSRLCPARRARLRYADRRPVRPGLAIREMIVAAVIIGLLIMLMMPLLLNRQAKARQVLCRERQRRLWDAIQHYEEFAARYPTYQSRLKDDRDVSQPLLSWVGAILPYLSADDGSAVEVVVDQYLNSANANKQRDLARLYLPELMCPTDVRAERQTLEAYLCFVANTGVPDGSATDTAPSDWPANGVLVSAADLAVLEKLSMKAPSRATIEQHDGADTTLLFAENIDAGKWTDNTESKIGFVWTPSYVNGSPARDDRQLLGINSRAGKGDGSYRFARPAGLHGRGVNVVYCGGQLRFMSESIDYIVLVNLMNSDITATREPGSEKPLRAPYRLED